MRKSEHFNLNLVEGTDIVNPLVQDVPNYEAIDEQLYKNQNNGICVATHLKNGTVHALNRTISDVSVFRFTATSDYEIGDTFTVDGVQVTAKLTSGETLGKGAFVINCEVLCVLVGTLLTVFASNGVVETAKDSEKLGGKDPAYYGTSVEVQNAVNAAQSAGTVANDAIAKTSPTLIECECQTIGTNFQRGTGKCLVHKIGNLVVGQYTLNNPVVLNSHALVTLAGGLPKPVTKENSNSISVIGYQFYNTECYGCNFNLYTDGTLGVYPSRINKSAGFICRFVYVCE